MVEIKIERKRKPIWIWLLLLLVLALVIWVIYQMASDRNEVEAEEVSPTGMVLPAVDKSQPVYLATV